MNYVTICFLIGIGFLLLIMFVGVARMKQDRMPSLKHRVEENQLIIGEAYLPIYKNIIDSIEKIFPGGE